MNQKSFSYESLQARHIRVLELEPAKTSSDFVSCRCIHVSLDDPLRPPYVAISYTWGAEREKAYHILVNGHLLRITQSVHDIFRSNRIQESNISLWIDAICINQDNKEEKSLQVTLMGEVYSGADHVRVWLGPSDENSSLAMSFTYTVCSILPAIETFDPERTLYYAQKYKEGGLEWAALANLLSRPWFTRTWVIQEVALSSNTYFVCGEDILDWKTLVRAITGMGGLGYNGMIATKPCSDLITIIGLN